MVFVIDIALDEPIRDDGFGGEGVDFLADGFGDELGGDALVPGFDDLPTTVAVADVTLEPVDTNLDEHKESPVAEPGQDEGEYGPYMLLSFLFEPATASLRINIHLPNRKSFTASDHFFEKITHFNKQIQTQTFLRSALVILHPYKFKC